MRLLKSKIFWLIFTVFALLVVSSGFRDYYYFISDLVYYNNKTCEFNVNTYHRANARDLKELGVPEGRLLLTKLHHVVNCSSGTYVTDVITIYDTKFPDTFLFNVKGYHVRSLRELSSNNFYYNAAYRACTGQPIESINQYLSANSKHYYALDFN